MSVVPPNTMSMAVEFKTNTSNCHIISNDTHNIYPAIYGYVIVLRLAGTD